MRLPDPPCQVHATCIAVAGRGLLILGASGTGKSGLALQLMAYGARLVCDDYCDLRVEGGAIIATRPPTLPEAIEARGVGLLPARCEPNAALAAVLTLDQTTDARLPEPQICEIGPARLPLLLKSPASHFPAALYHYLKSRE